jgi:hypothetical protein
MRSQGNQAAPNGARRGGCLGTFAGPWSSHDPTSRHVRPARTAHSRKAASWLWNVTWPRFPRPRGRPRATAARGGGGARAVRAGALLPHHPGHGDGAAEPGGADGLRRGARADAPAAEARRARGAAGRWDGGRMGGSGRSAAASAWWRVGRSTKPRRWSAWAAGRLLCSAGPLAAASVGRDGAALVRPRPRPRPAAVTFHRRSTPPRAPRSRGGPPLPGVAAAAAPPEPGGAVGARPGREPGRRGRRRGEGGAGAGGLAAAAAMAQGPRPRGARRPAGPLLIRTSAVARPAPASRIPSPVR